MTKYIVIFVEGDENYRAEAVAVADDGQASPSWLLGY
ncbi:hypothetical protein ACVIW2_004236 [Bradyrhizobium huanghuaihaiense]|nr:hypothetical protein [Bradyrhizobium japonicum]